MLVNYSHCVPRLIAMCPSLTLTRFAIRAGDLKTIHWSTATVSWSSSFWIVMSPPKNSSENGDTSVQSYRKIWGHAEMLITHDRSTATNTLTHSVTGSGTIMTHHARQLLCDVGWKCPIRDESLKCVSEPLVFTEMSSCPVCESRKCVTLFSIHFPQRSTDSCLCSCLCCECFGNWYPKWNIRANK